MERLLCNNQNCRQEINESCLVTSCSHIFCGLCIKQYFSGQVFSCIACDTRLLEKDDFKLVSLMMTESDKSLLLAGQTPEVIMEVCRRAMSFWVYQIQQEKYYMEKCNNELLEQKFIVKEKFCQITNDYKLIQEKLKTCEEAFKKQLYIANQKVTDFKKILTEKEIQLGKMQSLYDSTRRQLNLSCKFKIDSSFEIKPTNSGINFLNSNQHNLANHIINNNRNIINKNNVHDGLQLTLDNKTSGYNVLSPNSTENMISQSNDYLHPANEIKFLQNNSNLPIKYSINNNYEKKESKNVGLPKDLDMNKCLKYNSNNDNNNNYSKKNDINLKNIEENNQDYFDFNEPLKNKIF